MKKLAVYIESADGQVRRRVSDQPHQTREEAEATITESLQQEAAKAGEKVVVKEILQG